MVEHHRRLAVLVRPVGCPGVSVGALEEQPSRERAIDRHLQGVVVRAQPAVPEAGGGRPPELGEQGPALIAAARRSRVDVQVGDLPHRLSSYVTGRHDKVGRHFPLDDQVPRLNVAAVDLTRSRSPHVDCRRQIDKAGAAVWSGEIGNLLRKRPEGHKCAGRRAARKFRPPWKSLRRSDRSWKACRQLRWRQSERSNGLAQACEFDFFLPDFVRT